MVINRQQIALVGQRIRQLRKDRSLTQAELASKIGIQQSDLCRMETGEYKVSLETLFKTLKVFEMNIAEFFHVPASESLTAEEHELLTAWRALGSSGRAAVRDFIRFTDQRARRPRRSARRPRSTAP